MRNTTRKTQITGVGWTQSRISPRNAYTLLLRFLSNPCPNVTRIIVDNREDIAAIARNYRRMLAQSGYTSGFAEGAALFVRAFEQVELALDQLGYEKASYAEDVTYQGLKLLRGNRC